MTCPGLFTDKAVKTTGINCGTTVAPVWNAKFKTQPQANCDSYCLVI